MIFSSATLLFFTVVFLGEIAAQSAWIDWMYRRHMTQVQKAYGTRIDEAVKEKVPSLGGVVFLLVGSGMMISALVQRSSNGVIFWTYPILVAAVGLADDFLKFHRHSSEGLHSLQKFAMQAVVTILWFFLLFINGTTPLLLRNFSIGAWIWPFAFFFSVGLQNSVNVSDGLDGLAAGAAVISFVALAIISPDACQGSVVGAGLALGFLWHNCHPAQAFMGDTGSHFLAGLMASCALMGRGGVLALIPAGFGFGIEMISVVIQLLAIHIWGRRVFKMTPIHHHFQLLGWPEDKIVVRFWTIHAVSSALCCALFLNAAVLLRH